MEKKKLTIDDLKKIREKFQQQVTIRSGEARVRLIVHMGTCGIAAGARDILNSAISTIEKLKLEDVIVITSSCAGLCSREPMATVEIQHHAPIKYVDLTPEKIEEIIRKHIVGGQLVKEYALASGSETTA